MPIFPGPPTERERELGRLSRARRGEFAEFEGELLEAGSAAAAAAAIDAARRAEPTQRGDTRTRGCSEASYVQRFRELAGLAGRAWTSPDEFLRARGHKPIWPDEPTEREFQRGLGKRRLAELERMETELRQAGSVEAAAEACERSVSTYSRRFYDLARAARRASKTPQDFLAGEATRAPGGNMTGSGVPLAESIMLGMRVYPATKALAEQARKALAERTGDAKSWDTFMLGAAQHILSGNVFATVDTRTDGA